MMKMKPEWSKAFLIKPRDNIISHVFIKAPKFTVSYEKDYCPIPMNWLIGWEYARIWLKERNEYIAARDLMSKPKKIKNDYKWWLAKRAVTAKKTC